MININKKQYALSLNEKCGIVDCLRLANDPELVNIVHKDDYSAFGSVGYTCYGENWEYKECDSPVGIKNWTVPEYHAFANYSGQSNDRIRFANSSLQFSLEYEFFDDCFDIRLDAQMPEADMVAIDLNPAFIDIRQNDPVDQQYTLKSFYCSEDRSLAYVYLQRVGSNSGVLIHTSTVCAGWRILYRKYGVGTLQLVARFPDALDPQAVAGSLKLDIRVSFHEGLDEALTALGKWENIPVLRAPVLSGIIGDVLPFSSEGGYEKLILETPDNEKIKITTNEIKIEKEGCYTLRAYQGKKSYEVIFHARASLPSLLERSRQHLEPLFFNCNAEHFSWVQAMLLARRILGPDKRMDTYLYDALITIGRNGAVCKGMPVDSAPTPEQTITHLQRRHPTMSKIKIESDGMAYIGTPAPAPFKLNGRLLPQYHIYQTERIQDAFAFVVMYLEASQAYDIYEFYDYAVKIALAHIESHLCDDGALRKFQHNMMIDYTTVIAPAASLAELYQQMLARNDSRAEFVRSACIRIADYLMKRGMDFPTEGGSPHFRHSEDGSISCTALSLLQVYKNVEQKAEYLSFAGEILKYHHAWQIETNDVRSNCATFRYWETQWENDGEGRAINAGHVWNLWRGEALFHYGMISGDSQALIDSWNCFGCNLCKIQKNGATYSSFIPDYMVQRPREKKLYHCYPDNEDRTIAFYLWGRLMQTWFNTTVVVDTPENVPIALNGMLKKNENSFQLISHAESKKNIRILTKEKIKY